MIFKHGLNLRCLSFSTYKVIRGVCTPSQKHNFYIRYETENWPGEALDGRNSELHHNLGYDAAVLLTDQKLVFRKSSVTKQMKSGIKFT